MWTADRHRSFRAQSYQTALCLQQLNFGSLASTRIRMIRHSSSSTEESLLTEQVSPLSSLSIKWSLLFVLKGVAQKEVWKWIFDGRGQLESGSWGVGALMVWAPPNCTQHLPSKWIIYLYWALWNAFPCPPWSSKLCILPRNTLLYAPRFAIFFSVQTKTIEKKSPRIPPYILMTPSIVSRRSVSLPQWAPLGTGFVSSSHPPPSSVLL